MSAEAEVRTRRARAAADFGMWVFLASEGLIFGGLLLAYVFARLQPGADFAAASKLLSLPLGTANTAILLTSSLVVALATIWAEAGRVRATRIALVVTAGLGLVFLGIKSIEYIDEAARGLLPLFDGSPRYPFLPHPPTHLFFGAYLALTGTHALHLIGGITLMLGVAVLWHRLERPERVLRTCALYWHFVDVIWVVLFPLLYLVR